MTRSSKRRASTADDDSVHRAARLKAGRNLQDEFKGTTVNSFLHVPNESIASSLNNIGVSIGSDFMAVTDSITHIKQIERDRLLTDNTTDLKTSVFDKEEKEMAEEDEVDRFILNNLCSEIMDEVMDQDSEHIVQAHTDPRKGTTSKNKRKASKKKHSSA